MEHGLVHNIERASLVAAVLAMTRHTDGRTVARTDGRTDARTDGRTDRRTHARTHARTDVDPYARPPTCTHAHTVHIYGPV